MIIWKGEGQTDSSLSQRSAAKRAQPRLIINFIIIKHLISPSPADNIALSREREREINPYPPFTATKPHPNPTNNQRPTNHSQQWQPVNES